MKTRGLRLAACVLQCCTCLHSLLSNLKSRRTPLKMVLDPLASINGWTFDLAEKEPGKKFELTATFDPKGLKPGYVRQSVLLLTNVQAQHEIRLQANVAIRERIEAEPATLMIYPPATQPAYVQAAMQAQATRPAGTGQPGVIPRVIRVQNFGDGIRRRHSPTAFAVLCHGDLARS
jgi:hypothetical protein